jgi:hypothetical protein
MAALEQAAVNALGSVLNTKAPALIASIRRAAHFAKIESEAGSPVIMLDKQAILLGILDHGLSQPGQHASSAWLVDWLTRFLGHLPSALQKTIARLERSRVNLMAFGGSAKVIPSTSVDDLLPVALDLAQRTVKRKVIDLRHLVFALVGQAGSEWDFLSPRPSAGDFAKLRRQIVDHIISGPEPKEITAAWLALLPEPAPEPPRKRITRAERDDRYRTQSDDPARFDALERGPFAQVLAARIIEVRRSQRGDQDDDDRAFMVHLHGPWGSGKSSLLNLLQHELEHPREAEPPLPGGGKSGPALVVWFNAWKHQRMRPPWWALMNAIYRGAIRRCAASDDERIKYRDRLALWRLWWSWRWKAEILPVVLVAMVVIAALTFMLFGTEAPTLTEALGKIGITALAALAAVYTYARLMIFGSQKAVQAYADLTTDPYRRIVDLFNRLVHEITPPLIVFIDDLDRCDSAYVVELLEGIQTLFRHAPVTYVVAADRKWICSSFEKKYDDFAGSIGEPCRPLGYLFLDKLFQISAGMPRLTLDIQRLYLDALLAEGTPASTAPDPELVERAMVEMAGKSDEDEIEKAIAKHKSVPEQRAARHAGALQIVTAEATAKTEHRLKKLAHLLEPNPRSMKRLVNMVAMAQARGILEGRKASPETRARWAMLSLRWPLLAEFIADNPDAIAHWRRRKPSAGRRAPPKPDPNWPESVRALHGYATVMDVVGGAGEAGALTPQNLSKLLG